MTVTAKAPAMTGLPQSFPVRSVCKTYATDQSLDALPGVMPRDVFGAVQRARAPPRGGADLGKRAPRRSLRHMRMRAGSAEIFGDAAASAAAAPMGPTLHVVTIACPVDHALCLPRRPHNPGPGATSLHRRCERKIEKE